METGDIAGVETGDIAVGVEAGEIDCRVIDGGAGEEGEVLSRSLGSLLYIQFKALKRLN